MVIKQANDYDMISGILLGGYMKAISNDDWSKAIHVLHMMNSSLTSQFRIDPLPEFKPTYADSKNHGQQAFAYCDKYIMMILQANSLERETLYNSYRNQSEKCH